jgi:4-oxalomesaconate tautomerase
MQTAIPCSIFRGGTSKGLYFLAQDLPSDPALRDRVLLAALGSPDIRQIDGMGGAHPLTSKVAIVSGSPRPDADIDYLFLQVVVDEARVDAGQNCGNILAGVGPFAIDQRLVAPERDRTKVRIHMLNTGSLAEALIETPGGEVRYDGDARIDGVPGTAAPIPLNFLEVAGSSCGSLLPTGEIRDRVEGVDITCIDNGMPVVVLRAADFGKTGRESPAELEADEVFVAHKEAIRLEAGRRMNLGDVVRKTVPKMSFLSPAMHGGTLSTRTFIPRRVHEAIGVLGAVSIATAAVIEGSVAAEFVGAGEPGRRVIDVEHPTGFFTVDLAWEGEGPAIKITRSALLRTARKLMQGEVYVPESVWDGLE